MKLQFNKYIIKSLDTSDGRGFFALVDKNRTRLEPYFPGTCHSTRTLVHTLDYMFQLDDKLVNKSYYPYVIIDAEKGCYAGFIDIKSIDWRIPKGEVGYFIDSAYEGLGIMSKALALVSDFVASTYGFRKLLSRAAPDNIGSCRVAEKAGFSLEGRLRNDFRINTGEIVDINYYGKVF